MHTGGHFGGNTISAAQSHTMQHCGGVLSPSQLHQLCAMLPLVSADLMMAAILGPCLTDRVEIMQTVPVSSGYSNIIVGLAGWSWRASHHVGWFCCSLHGSPTCKAVPQPYSHTLTSHFCLNYLSRRLPYVPGRSMLMPGRPRSHVHAPLSVL